MKKKGVIKIRTCPECGQKQLGIITEDGKFFPLHPGMYIEILEEEKKEEPEKVPFFAKKESTHTTTKVKAWLPEQLKKNKILRIRYGVIIKEGEDIVDASSYRKAFIEKLQSLIEKESFSDLAILFDIFFHSPHLAAGNSAEIALNLLRDIKEIQRPLLLMEEWLKNKTKENFSQLMYSIKDDSISQITDSEFLEELQNLTLREFLETL